MPFFLPKIEKFKKIVYMASKTDTRIRHKHDTEENWFKITGFILLLGE